MATKGALALAGGSRFVEPIMVPTVTKVVRLAAVGGRAGRVVCLRAGPVVRVHRDRLDHDERHAGLGRRAVPVQCADSRRRHVAAAGLDPRAPRSGLELGFRRLPRSLANRCPGAREHALACAGLRGPAGALASGGVGGRLEDLVGFTRGDSADQRGAFVVTGRSPFPARSTWDMHPSNPRFCVGVCKLL